MADRKMGKRREPVTWVKIRQRGEVVCQRCGETHKFVMPMPADDFVKAGKAFVKLHSFCVDRSSPPSAVPAEGPLVVNVEAADGTELVECDSCDGTGLMEGWNHRDGHSCPKCHGSGTMPAPSGA